MDEFIFLFLRGGRIKIKNYSSFFCNSKDTIVMFVMALLNKSDFG
uniref:Uncharacterized protein n=1 Tax=Klebsiella pneumoniae TaxID=573 RepID=A0A7G5F6W6_KLEPN|nr:hypothetical protein [Klebsiella pneumoniae]